MILNGLMTFVGFLHLRVVVASQLLHMLYVFHSQVCANLHLLIELGDTIKHILFGFL